MSVLAEKRRLQSAALVPAKKPRNELVLSAGGSAQNALVQKVRYNIMAFLSFFIWFGFHGIFDCYSHVHQILIAFYSSVIL